MSDRYDGGERAQRRRRLETLAWLMDHSIPLPGVQYRIGVDGLLGLIPGFGDAVGALVSTYLIGEAARLGAPRSVLVKMAFNVGLDALLGAIPLFGDLFDFAWRANRRNLRLLDAYLERPGQTAAVSRAFVAALCILIIVAVAGIVLIGAAAVRWAWVQLTGS
jgi:hypothetical protein